MRVEALTAFVVAFLFSVVASETRAEDKLQAPASASELTSVEGNAETRAPDAAAMMAQAPADPNAQVLADIKVYPCF